MYQCLKKLVNIKNTVVLTIATFRHIQYLHLMYAEVAWALVSSRTQFQPQILLDPDYLPDYLSVSYDYGSLQIILRVIPLSLGLLYRYYTLSLEDI